MMRFRVAAQAFTIGAIIVGVAIQTAKGNSGYPNKSPPDNPNQDQKWTWMANHDEGNEEEVNWAHN